MRVLGIHGGLKFPEEEDFMSQDLHDSAAVLIYNGEVIAAIEEERLNRIKHTNCFPAKAIRKCLDLGRTNLGEIDRIAINWAENVVTQSVHFFYQNDARAPRFKDAQSRINGLFQECFGSDVSGKLAFCDHHVSHAYSAIAGSGFPDALVVALDGVGDYGSGLVLSFEGHETKVLTRFSISQSLGLLYQSLSKFIGYSYFEEYKVMALAALGDPEKYRGVFERNYQLLPEGNYEVADREAWFACFLNEEFLTHTRQRTDPILECHADFAAALQAMLENIVMHVLRHFQQVTGKRRCCLAGGVAHNCAMNGKISRSGLFADIYVPPAAHDAGGALGAAVLVDSQKATSRQGFVIPNVYSGVDIGGDEQVQCELDQWTAFLDFRKSTDLFLEVARLIRKGDIVGWVQGRSEFGPRALGNRSILADPTVRENRDRINAAIKKREEYRPFAPAVTDESAATFFELCHPAAQYRNMAIAVRVRPEWRSTLAAVTHVDGTARLQTVSARENPAFWGLIKSFGELTGVPVLLNTSFNNDSEPIVESVEDAIVCFLTTQLDYLIVGNWIVSKSKDDLKDNLLRLKPTLMPHTKLVKRSCPDHSGSQTAYEIEGTKGFYQAGRVQISREMFTVLAASCGHDSIGVLISGCVYTDEVRKQLVGELTSLWERRFVRCRP